MEAATLPKKKNTISKGKLKKSIKNVLCRPDPVFWPEITEDEGKRLESTLKKHKIDIPEFKKPHWKTLKLIPKEKRPRPPQIKKVDGLLFGIRECADTVQNKNCAAIIIEAKVNPRMIVQPILEMCRTRDVPVLCLNDLRNVTRLYFGVSTSCLGIKCNSLSDVTRAIVDIAKNHPKPKLSNDLKKSNNIEVEKMEKVSKVSDATTFQFLYRTSKKSRIFVPNASENVKQPTKFIGQDFIEFSEKPAQKDSKAYMKMILKRISNNPDRVKKK
uniref:Ribosomal protein L7Ae/L30e/S12e/Gadd45 domain-containing protein n=1 Tax=Heliothis virescens TaxID=7102 RepID=A0A2A4K0X1_HELVI